jgi:hypothetical protein
VESGFHAAHQKKQEVPETVPTREARREQDQGKTAVAGVNLVAGQFEIRRACL